MLPETTPVAKGWVCPDCTTRTRKGDNTPVRAASSTAAAAISTATAGSKQDSLRAPVVDVTPSSSPVTPPINHQDMHREMAEWMAEMRDFRREMIEFRAAVLGLSTRMDSIEQRLVIVENRHEESPSELADMRSKLILLQQELNDRDQDALLSDLEIGQFPEEKGENVVHTAMVLAAKLGVALEERDVVFAERVGVAQIAGAAGERPRPRRIVVRLARRHLRDQMLQAARVRRNLTSADASRDPSAIAGATAPPRARIYLNERLTRANRLLFHRVREECRRHQWRFSWTTRGRVYARQADGKDRFPFRSEEDVVRVFGHGTV